MYSEPIQTSNMKYEAFLKIINDFNPLTMFVKVNGFKRKCLTKNTY